MNGLRRHAGRGADLRQIIHAAYRLIAHARGSGFSRPAQEATPGAGFQLRKEALRASGPLLLTPQHLKSGAVIFDVYRELAQRGCRAFFSEVSVPEMGGTDFQRAIDQAIEGARHLVLICSSANHVLKPWVEAEWRLFEALRRSGRKSGNIVPLLFGGLQRGRMPATLSVFNCVAATGSPEEWAAELMSHFR